VEEYISQFKITFRSDTSPMLRMHWTMVIGADGGFSLRAEWNHLRLENFDGSDYSKEKPAILAGFLI
jgi:hypothetical protein